MIPLMLHTHISLQFSFVIYFYIICLGSSTYDNTHLGFLSFISNDLYVDMHKTVLQLIFGLNVVMSTVIFIYS